MCQVPGLGRKVSRQVYGGIPMLTRLHISRADLPSIVFNFLESTWVWFWGFRAIQAGDIELD